MFKRIGLLALVCSMALPGVSVAQYFGKNKVQYTKFDFKVIKTEHFDIYFYERERVAAMDAARMAERAYARLSRILSHEFKERKPIILYASSADFEQTNTLNVGEGTGGVTDFFKHRSSTMSGAEGRRAPACRRSSGSIHPSGSPRVWPNTCRSAALRRRRRCGFETRPWKEISRHSGS